MNVRKEEPDGTKLSSCVGTTHPREEDRANIREDKGKRIGMQKISLRKRGRTIRTP